MILRLIWLAPVGLITALLAVYGFRWGYIAANITETDVITTYATVYLEEGGMGARPSDCAAFPGDRESVWIIVRCQARGNGDGKIYEYHANRLGGLEYSGPPRERVPQLGENDV